MPNDNKKVPSNLEELYTKWISEIRSDHYMAELSLKYKEWLGQLQSSSPHFFINNANDKGKYSNPHYIYVPKEWSSAKNKIMIVGEEGYGHWGCGKAYGWAQEFECWSADDIEDIILYNRDLLFSQTRYLSNSPDSLDGEEFLNWFHTLYGRKRIYTAYWKRIANIYSHYNKDSAFIINNLDKIFILKKDNERCALSVEDRKALHSVEVKILKEEIEKTETTMVVFNGWYGTSIHYELPEVYDLFYTEKALKEWDENRICHVNHEIGGRNVDFVLAYHPGFRVASLKGLFNGSKSEYENKLIETIGDCILK